MDATTNPYMMSQFSLKDSRYLNLPSTVYARVPLSTVLGSWKRSDFCEFHKTHATGEEPIYEMLLSAS